MKLYIQRYLFLIAGFLIIASSCSDEFEGEKTGSGHLWFTADLYEGDDVSTRGPGAELLNRTKFDHNFYLAFKNGDKRKCNIYLIPQDRDGVLRSYGTTDSLIWQSAVTEHYFYGWTMPWVDKDPYMDEPGEENDNTRISFTPDDDMYLTGTDTDTPRNIYEKSLENFIGAGFGPVTYNNNGEYINFQFRHLVSKIYIETFRFSYIDEQGNPINTPVNGTMIFDGLPAEGFFIREGEGGPFVMGNPESKEVSYTVGSRTTLYVCPNVDFSNVKFKIRSQDPKIPSAGDFLGDFSSITFERDYSDNWILENMLLHPGTDPEHTLYAGETLTLVVTLRQSKGNYVAASIGGWSTQGVREAGAYPYPGIYNGNQLRSFYDLFRDGYDDEEVERMFNNYGDPDENEFRLYDDLNEVSHGFRMSKKYVLNGMGHTIIFKPTHTSSDGNPYVKISKAKDIYLSDTEGNTVYIDENFNVYLVNSDGSMTLTDHLDDLPSNRNAYNVDLKTGKVTFASTP